MSRIRPAVRQSADRRVRIIRDRAALHALRILVRFARQIRDPVCLRLPACCQRHLAGADLVSRIRAVRLVRQHAAGRVCARCPACERIAFLRRLLDLRRRRPDHRQVRRRADCAARCGCGCIGCVICYARHRTAGRVDRDRVRHQRPLRRCCRIRCDRIVVARAVRRAADLPACEAVAVARDCRCQLEVRVRPGRLAARVHLLRLRHGIRRAAAAVRVVGQRDAAVITAVVVLAAADRVACRRCICRVAVGTCRPALRCPAGKLSRRRARRRDAAARRAVVDRHACRAVACRVGKRRADRLLPDRVDRLRLACAAYCVEPVVDRRRVDRRIGCRYRAARRARALGPASERPAAADIRRRCAVGACRVVAERLARRRRRRHTVHVK